MRIAITADAHLSVYKETPERYNAIKDIFKQATSSSLETVLIAGDLFNDDFNNYSDFEKLAKEFPDLNIWILPGNHDSGLSSRVLTGKNIRVFEKPELIKSDLTLLLIPFLPNATMGEVIARHIEHLKPKKWVLFGHGDWLDGTRKPNLIEPGTYMPLTRNDLDRYQPNRVFLGHIHAQKDRPIFYPGSPCGVDISETGMRRFLVFNTATGIVESKSVNSDVIYQNVSLSILPVDDEAAYIHNIITSIKNEWNVRDNDISKIEIRVKGQGYTKDKSALYALILEEFKGFSFYKDESPDLSQVATTLDLNKIIIAEKVKEKIETLELSSLQDDPDKDQILLEALKLIFES